jgi:hypothetical protein
LSEVGLPTAKIVIDINARNPPALRAAFEGGNLFRHGTSMLEQRFPVRKGEIINDIDEEQGDRGLIRGIAM